MLSRSSRDIDLTYSQAIPSRPSIFTLSSVVYPSISSVEYLFERNYFTIVWTACQSQPCKNASGKASGTEATRPLAQSPKTTRGEGISVIKHSSLSDSHTKSKASLDSEGQKEKATGNVSPVLRTPIITRSGRRNLFVLKVPSMTRSQPDTKRLAASSYLR